MALLHFGNFWVTSIYFLGETPMLLRVKRLFQWGCKAYAICNSVFKAKLLGPKIGGVTPVRAYHLELPYVVVLLQITDQGTGVQLFYRSGSTTTRFLNSQSNSLRLYFYSDGSVTRKGFRIAYMQNGGMNPIWYSLEKKWSKIQQNWRLVQTNRSAMLLVRICTRFYDQYNAHHNNHHHHYHHHHTAFNRWAASHSHLAF